MSGDSKHRLWTPNVSRWLKRYGYDRTPHLVGAVTVGSDLDGQLVSPLRVGLPKSVGAGPVLTDGKLGIGSNNLPQRARDIARHT